MAPRIIFSFNPSRHIVKAPNTPDTVISVVANNVAFQSSFPNQIESEELQDFANFLASCRLRYALADIPMFIYPKQICEFYYTCTYSPATNLITGTVANGTVMSPYPSTNCELLYVFQPSMLISKFPQMLNVDPSFHN